MARKLTLGQATGGKPAKVAARPAPRPAAPAPQQAKPPPAPKLGLRLGLGAQQRGNLQAAAAGQNPGYLNAHPQLQNRINTQIRAGNPAMQQFFNSGGQSQAPQPRGGVNSDVMGGQTPQPPPTQQQPPLNATGMYQTPTQSMGQVGGAMQGQNAGGYGYRPQSMGQQMGQMGAGMMQQPPYRQPMSMGQMGAQAGSYLTGYGGGAGSGGGAFNPQNPMANYPSFQQQPNPYQQGAGQGVQPTGAYGGFGGQAAQRGQQLYGQQQGY